MSNNPRKGVRKKKSSLLSRPEVQSEFSVIRVAIRRLDIVNTGPTRPLQRSLDDPSQLIIPRQGEWRGPIFDRDEVLCNEVDCDDDERPSLNIESTRKVFKNLTREKSKSPSDGHHPYNRRSRSHSVNSNTSGTNRSRRKSRERRSRSGDYRKQSESRHRSKERSPLLRPGEYRPKRSEVRHRSKTREYSPPLKPGEYRPRKGEVKRRSKEYSPPLRPGEYRPKKTNFPRRSRSHEYTPEKSYHSSSRRSRSNSPKPSTSKRYSRSPDRNRGHYSPSRQRSRSSGRYKRQSEDRKRSRSPKYESSYRSKERRHSRSPPRSYEKKGSPGYDRYRRDSRSPSRHGYKKSYNRHRSRSPHPPIVTFDRPSSSRRSRSPKSYIKSYHGASEGFRKSRGRSPQKLTPQYPPYYEAPEFWIPPMMPFRPAIYPGPFPHGIPGPRLIYPRVPDMVYPYRPRYPIYNSTKTIVKKVTKESTTPSAGSANVSTTSLENNVVEEMPSTSSTVKNEERAEPQNVEGDGLKEKKDDSNLKD